MNTKTITQNEAPTPWPENPAYFAPRTVRGVLWGKCLDVIDEASLHGIAQGILGVAAVGSLTVAMYNINLFTDAGKMAITAGDGLLPKVAASAILVLYWRQMMRFAATLRPRQAPIKAPNIDGIPTAELLDHLFTFGTFKRDEIEGKFGVPRNRFDALAKKLDEMGVTVHDRQKNNARVLNPAYSRQDVAAILAGKRTAKDLQGGALKQVDQRTWTTDPTATQIEARVQDALRPVFTIRPLNP